MPITYWNRLEVRSRSEDIWAGLSAVLRDPLFILTRQWQTSEFEGEDAGSAAWVDVGYTSGYIPGGIPTLTFLEKEVESEAFTPTLMLRLDLGQVFETLLEAEAETELIQLFRRDYPLQVDALADIDTETSRILLLSRGRVLDGYALLQGGEPPFWSNLTASQQDIVERAVTMLSEWSSEVFGVPGIGLGKAAAWRSQTLDYSHDITTQTDYIEELRVRVTPASTGAIDWYSVDVVSSTSTTLAPLSDQAIPSRIFFPGMPNPRWWEFENSQTDYAALWVNRQDLARMMIADFTMRYENDWFTIPFRMQVGQLAHVYVIHVNDVFDGITTLTPRNEGKAWKDIDWVMFTHSDAENEVESSFPPFFYLVPSVSSALQVGNKLEEVAFLLDDVSNLIWGVEQTIEGALGKPRPGHIAESSTTDLIEESVVDESIALTYELQSSVPTHWFPFIADEGEIVGDVPLKLRLGTTLGFRGIKTPRGRVLQGYQPQGLSIEGSPPHLNVYAVPRHGVRIVRRPFVARWTDGRTHLWIGRERHPYADVGSHQLLFDQVISRKL